MAALILPGTRSAWMQMLWPHTTVWLGIDVFGVSLAEEIVILAGHRVVVQGMVLAGILPGGSWMVDSLSKPPSGKFVMMIRSLVEGGRGKVSVEMFNPLDEDVLL